jgi:hypothetical protein
MFVTTHEIVTSASNSRSMSFEKGSKNGKLRSSNTSLMFFGINRGGGRSETVDGGHL